MGFFSAVKKFFGAKPGKETPETSQVENQEIESSQGVESQERAFESAQDTARQSESQIQATSGIPPSPEKDETTAVELKEAETLAQDKAEMDSGAEIESDAAQAIEEVAQPEEAVVTASPAKMDLGATNESEIAPEPNLGDKFPGPAQAAPEIPTKTAQAAERESEFADLTKAERESEFADLTKKDSEKEKFAPEATESKKADQTPEASIPELPADQAPGSENEALLLRLRQAEPRLSEWLAIVLENQERVSPEFWSRLTFFLQALEAPQAEIDAFIANFRSWLDSMEYSHIDEFRSELQYRLALALDLEDEEDERNRLLLKLSQGLAATREHLGRQLDAIFASHGELTDAFWEELEEMFIMADMGYEASLEIVDRLKRAASRKKATQASEARDLLLAELEEIFRQQPRIKAVNKPEVILMMGVNGAGKTTTIAKLAHREVMAGKKVLVAAADTFRAAAIEQLQIWAKRAGADFYAKPAGSDPAAVAWEAMDYAQKNDVDVVFVDTAGRLQTRVNLMEELGKIRQVLGKKSPGAPHRSMLVLDATTGQNALSQAKLFREAAGADEIALTKLDGTAKGGVAIAVAMQENLPITYVGLGEKMEDLRPFNGRDFAAALLEPQDGKAA